MTTPAHPDALRAAAERILFEAVDGDITTLPADSDGRFVSATLLRELAAVLDRPAPPAEEHWQHSSALELMKHIQAGHQPVSHDSLIRCTCGTDWLPVRPTYPLTTMASRPAPEPAPPGFLKVEITYGARRHLVIQHADMGHDPAVVDRINDAAMEIVGESDKRRCAEAPHA